MAAGVRQAWRQAALNDTIFALSSGSPPAGIAVVRISGPQADASLRHLARRVPEPRRAALLTLRDGDDVLDRALVLRFPGPASATGEDVVELHLHGGRAVVEGVLAVLQAQPGLRPAAPGEFTRRAFEHGRIDLAEAEGLADLLLAETQSQRRAAIAAAGGTLSRQVMRWTDTLLGIAALVEAELDFADEDDVGNVDSGAINDRCRALVSEIDRMLAQPPAERLRDGIRVVIAGPPNAGKSSLLNALVGRQAAIATAIAGTTRDIIEAPVAFEGVPFVLTDTAGLREAQDSIEQIGVGLAQQAVAAADIVLWLGAPEEAPPTAVKVSSKSDVVPADEAADLSVSAATGEGLDQLRALLLERAASLLPAEGEAAFNHRQRRALGDCTAALRDAASSDDLLVVAEFLRLGRAALDRVTGRAHVEDMLDGLFGKFCIGK